MTLLSACKWLLLLLNQGGILGNPLPISTSFILIFFYILGTECLTGAGLKLLITLTTTLILTFTLFNASSEEERVPLEYFVKHSEFSNLIISPTGKFMAASSLKQDGSEMVVVFNIEKMEMTARIDFVQNQKPDSLTWLNDDRIGIRIARQFNFLDAPSLTDEYYAMNADGTKKENLWGMSKVGGAQLNPKISTMDILHLLPDDPKNILVSETVYSGNAEAFTPVYQLNIYNGRKRKVANAPLRGASMLSDHNAEIRFAIGVDAAEINQLKVFYREENGDDWRLTNQFNPKEGTLVPIAFSSDNNHVYAYSNMGASTQGLVKLDVKTGKSELIYRHPLVDLNDVMLTQSMQLVSASVSPDYNINIPLTDHPLNKWLDELQKIFKQDTVTITSTTRDDERMIVAVSSASKPVEYYFFDTKSMELRFLVSSRSWIDPAQMAQVKPIKMTARDGVELHGYLTIPKGSDGKNLPLIVHPHGGPHGPRDFWSFSPDAQVLASRGYAVLQINFRGSGGYGREFMYSGYGKWGTSMQDDITDATLWAVEEGYADAKRMCIYGASYGGYASIMGVVKEPDLYQCAIGFVGVYSLPMMFEKGDIPDRRSGINFLKEALGEDEASLKARSPAYNVDKIKAEIMLVHGGKDERVPIEQAEFLMAQFDDIGKSYEWFVKEREGHGFYKPENRLELYQKQLMFFDKHIGKARK